MKVILVSDHCSPCLHTLQVLSSDTDAIMSCANPMLSHQETSLTQCNQVFALHHAVASNAVQEYLVMTTKLNSLQKTDFVWYHVLFKTGQKFQSRALTMFWPVTTSNQAMHGLSEPVSWPLFLLFYSCMLCETKIIFK